MDLMAIVDEDAKRRFPGRFLQAHGYAPSEVATDPAGAFHR
jgi:hypothetical protein